MQVSAVAPNNCHPCSVCRIILPCRNNSSRPTPNPRVFSVDLQFRSAPEDLMMVFVDALIHLPNLKRLELLSVSHRTPAATGAELKIKKRAATVLGREYAMFPNIREILIEPTYPDIIKNCPNLESLTFLRTSSYKYIRRMIKSYGSRLKRVTGIRHRHHGLFRYLSCEFAIDHLVTLGRHLIRKHISCGE